jgi:integrase
MASAFQTFLKSLQPQIERIQMELLGYTEEKKVIKNKTVETTWSPPATPPKNKVSKTLNDAIKRHYPDAVIKKTSAATLLDVWKNVIQVSISQNLRMFMDIFRRLQELLEYFYTAEGTLATATTAWRKPIIKRYGEGSDIYKQSIFILGISRERSLARRAEYTAKVREATKQRGNKIKYTQEHIFSVIDACNESTNPQDFVIAVCLCTGSRLIECIKVSEYSTVSDKPQYIKLYGIAKDKQNRNKIEDDDDDVVIVKKTIVKPVLRLSPLRIVEMVKKIREHWKLKNVDNATATSKVDSGVNRRLQDFFGHVDAAAPDTKKTTAHKLRHIYASLAYQLYGEPYGVAENEFVREVLGHDSNEVSVAYQSIVVDVPGSKRNQDRNLPSDIRYKLGELQHDLKDNEKEHQEMKGDIKNVETELNRTIAEAQMIDLQFPQFANPKRIRLSKEAKLERIAKLDKSLSDAGIHATQALFKKYGYGSSLIHDYYRVRAEHF